MKENPELGLFPEKWWAGPGSNRRPSPRKGDIIPLDHRPRRFFFMLTVLF
jgi:hypothetical protein